MATTLPPTAPEAEWELAELVPRRSRLRSFVLGRESDPRWVRPALFGLLALTALLYLWGLGASGWANAYYSAAVQAGTKSWTAFFFGSFDSSSFITVDKTPASLWVMELSARVFGVSSWSILVPQALEGVAAVGLLYATVRRRFTPAAGLIAGAVLALTPVATLMFRFNNPDALLVLLLVGAAYATTRALERGSTRWLVLAGALVGFGFLAKMLQAFLVVPVFALVYLLAAPVSLRRRAVQLLAAGVALVVSAGWWVAVVTLLPESARPYIGGSQTNSVLDLMLGYNGLGRLTGEETGSVGGGPAGTGGRWGETGWDRLFNADIGGQISWLVPAALLFLVALLWTWRRGSRTDGRRAAVLLWGGWLVVTGLVFGYMQGIFHAYYTVALAPAIGALVGIGATTLWQRRASLAARAALAAAVAGTAVWAYVLLGRSPDWYPELRVAVLAVGLAASALILVAPLLNARVAAVAAAVALGVSVAAPAAYSLETASTPHTGAIPSAGPAVRGGGFGGGPQGGFGPGGGPQGGFQANGGPRNGFGGDGGQGNAGRPGGGGLGGLLDASTPDAELVRLLQEDAGSYTWVAATVGANNAAGLQLASDEPIMAIGGFNGSDPAPTLAEFQQYVEDGEIHYFVASRNGGGGPSGQSEIASWVEQSFTAQTVGGATVYDLASPSAQAGADAV